MTLDELKTEISERISDKNEDLEGYYKIRKIGDDLLSLISRIRQLDDSELKMLMNSLKLTVNELEANNNCTVIDNVGTITINR